MKKNSCQANKHNLTKTMVYQYHLWIFFNCEDYFLLFYLPSAFI